jgi:hypothetical protein
MKLNLVFKILLWLGALFFITEFFFHFFGLPILEHDKIFIFTHDRYIAIMALTYSTLLVLISTNAAKYKHLFILTMIGILIMVANGAFISHTGGYRTYFPVKTLDQGVGFIGYSFFVWYILVWVLWFSNAKLLWIQQKMN